VGFAGMEVKQLGFLGMLSYFQVVIAGITDPRSAGNATRYSLKRDNAQSLFGLVNIPTVEQMRNILDGIAAKHLFPWFRWIDQGLKEPGYLRGFEASASPATAICTIF